MHPSAKGASYNLFVLYKPSLGDLYKIETFSLDHSITHIPQSLLHSSPKMSQVTIENNKPYILLIGNAAVGKSSYVLKLANQGFNEFYTPTTGHVDTHIPGLYNFIELSGQEQANEYAEEVLARADRIYVMASKSSKASIENIPFWINKYEHLHLNYTIIINKCDIESIDFNMEQSLHEAVEQFYHYVNIHYISCKDGPMFV